MFRRIHVALLQHADNAFVNAQLNNMSRASISTFDSFCAQIARETAGQFGIAPTFEQDERQFRHMARETILTFLYRHHDNPTLARFIAVHGFTQVWQDCLVPLAEDQMSIGREDWLEGLAERQLARLRTILTDAVAAIATTSQAMGAIPTTGALAERQRQVEQSGAAALVFPPVNATIDTRTDGAIPSNEDHLRSLLNTMRDLQRLNLRGGARNDPSATTNQGAYQNAQEYAKIAEQAIQTLRCEDQVRELYGLMLRLHADLSRAKRQQHLLSYADVVSIAVRGPEKQQCPAAILEQSLRSHHD